MKVLPMGFSWSFYLAQEAHRAVAQRALPETFLSGDGAPPPRPSREGGVGLIYADNSVLIGADPEGVNDRQRRLKEVVKVLGVHFNGLEGCVRPTAGRLWRLDGALSQVRPRSGVALRRNFDLSGRRYR